VSQFGALGWKVGAGEEKGDEVLGGSIFSNWRRERGGWGSAWRSQVEEKMKGGGARASEEGGGVLVIGSGVPLAEVVASRVMRREQGRWKGGSGLVGRSERNSDIL
jgi:hypothetical protein